MLGFMSEKAQMLSSPHLSPLESMCAIISQNVPIVSPYDEHIDIAASLQIDLSSPAAVRTVVLSIAPFVSESPYSLIS